MNDLIYLNSKAASLMNSLNYMPDANDGGTRCGTKHKH